MTKILIITSMCMMICFAGNALAASGSYPQEVAVIKRDQANYVSPENTYCSIHSCALAEDLNWCDETMTDESLHEIIQLFSQSGIDRKKIFELAKNVKQSQIVDKFVYKNAVILLVEDYGYNGSINKMPLTFIEEKGKWKLTNKYSSDVEIMEYLYYVPPLFDGKWMSADANSFLGYEQPTQVQTNLAAGVTTYTVHVYYGKTVAPETFTAVLNEKDIGLKFTPKPFTDEEVVIPLQRGRNTLLLSTEGKKSDGEAAIDSDRLVFVVP